MSCRQYMTIVLAVALVGVLAGCRSASAATDELSATARREQREAAAFAAKQRTDPYTGWAYVPQKKIDISNGLVRIVMNGSAGTFCVYARQDGEADVPLFSTADSFVSSYFSVRIGRQAYKLSKEGGAKCESRLTPYGAQMAYTVSGKAYVVVDFSFLPSSADSGLVDMLRVSVYCINIGKTVQSFAVKGVFDTYLGESTRTHFSTYTDQSINTERSFTAMESALWIRSRNDRAAMQFLLHGAEITEPESVVLANKDSFTSSAWVPSVQENRSFTSVLSYENSAVGIVWPAVYLDPLKSDVLTFYISLTADGTAPAGREFLRELAAGRTALWNRPGAALPVTDSTDDAPGPAAAAPSATDSTAPATPSAAASDDDELSLFGPTYEEPVRVPPAVPAAETGAASAEPVDPQLDPEYIQSLIDRIDELSKNPSLADEVEIESLHEELDTILMKLRSRR